MSLTPQGADRWPVRRLGDVLIRHNEVVHPGERSGEATFVGLEHIEPNSGRRIGSSTLDLGSLTGRKPTFKEGQIVYGYLRPYLNKVWVAEFDGYSSVDQFAFDVRPELAETEFVAAFMRSDTFLRRASIVTTTGQLPRIGTDEIAAVPIELPPLEVQRSIVSQLAEQLVAAESARRAAEERLGAAKAIASACLREVFHGREAIRWPRAPIASLGDPATAEVVQTGPFGAQLPSSEFRSAGIPVLNIGNVKNGRLSLDRLDHVSPRKAEQLARYRLRAGDMLFTRSGSVGRSAVVDASCEGWLISYHLLRVSFDRERIEPEFISAAVQADPTVLAQVGRAAGRGATRDGINASILADLIVPTPPLETQRRFVKHINSRLSEARYLESVCEAEVAAVSSIPAALRRATFGGRG